MALKLPFQPPLAPMLAKLANELPSGDGWIFEPKWDGFRALVWNSDAEVYLQSRDEKPLGRYFPELEASLRAALPGRCVLDGEVVIATGDRLDFDALLIRIHPAASRVQLLAEQNPSSYVAWDLLAEGDVDLRDRPQAERRERLERLLADVKPPVHVSPATRDRAVAQVWFDQFEGAGLDGVMAKPETLTYQPGKRAMLKIKHQRTADCVVGGFRWYKNGKGTLVGSLMLGLYDEAGALHYVGIASSFKQAERARLAAELGPLTEGAVDGHPWRDWAQSDASDQRRPGASSRWNRGKDLSWQPLQPRLVVEVSYDHLQGTRFRHATHVKRWRPDKAHLECRFDQLDQAPPFLISEIFRAR